MSDPQPETAPQQSASAAESASAASAEAAPNGSKAPAPAAAQPSPDEEGQRRGFIFDLFDEMSNAAFVHYRLIAKIQKLTNRKLVTYCGLFAHPGGIITNEDAESIESILRSCDMSKFAGLDLMINSPGGMPEAAGDIIRVCRTYAQSFRVIVPNMAMSAATLLAMGSDAIVMSDTSKLGPIDPQMVYQTKEGAFMRAAHSFIQAFGSLVSEANQLSANNQTVTAHLHLLTKQDPSWIVECVRARQATEKLATRVLKDGMLSTKSPAEIADVASKFLKKGDDESHGTRISPDEARIMGLNIERVERDCEFWNAIWQLHVRLDHYTRSKVLAKYICSDSGALEFQVRQLAGT